MQNTDNGFIYVARRCEVLCECGASSACSILYGGMHSAHLNFHNEMV